MSTPFSGFTPAALGFLADLADNNDKAWFAEHRATYDAEILGPSRAFVEALAPGLRELDPSLQCSPKVGGSLYRIYRDVRFSKDKRPLKTEVGFKFLPPGDKGATSGLYLRFLPGTVEVGTGCWGFSKEALQRYRHAVADETRGAAFVAALGDWGLPGEGFHAQRLKRVPKPWPQDHPRGELLKCKGYFVGKAAAVPEAFFSARFVDWCLDRFGELAPVHHWLQDALEA